MARRNNPADMTITEQLDVIKEEVCDKLCRYPDMVDNGELTEELFEIQCDIHCPLNKLSLKNLKKTGGGLT